MAPVHIWHSVKIQGKNHVKSQLCHKCLPANMPGANGVHHCQSPAADCYSLKISSSLSLRPLCNCRTVMNNDPSLLRKLEKKVTQERELTDEWTEKWKEATKILKEQSALALKQVREKCLSFVACQCIEPLSLISS